MYTYSYIYIHDSYFMIFLSNPFKTILFRQLSHLIPTFPAPPFAHVAGSSYAPAVGQPHPAPPGAFKRRLTSKTYEK